MFSEEELREAAAEYNAAMVKAVLRDYDPEQQHVFSPGYERKIRRLKRRADHPVFYRVLRSAAALLLSLLIGGGALLAVSPSARAAFVGWVKEVWAEFFVYHFEGDAANVDATAPLHYRPAWLPERYEEYCVNESGGSVSVYYKNPSDLILIFRYSNISINTDWYIDASTSKIKFVNVNGIQGTYLLSTDSEIASTLLWETHENTAFYISGYLSEEHLLRIAESVKIFP